VGAPEIAPPPSIARPAGNAGEIENDVTAPPETCGGGKEQASVRLQVFEVGV
jgi:hypothetical protein